MAPNQKILSICIPTYNREKALDQTLQDLEKEMAPVQDLVEICVSDNGSPDNTQAVIAKWSKKLPIVASRNSGNLGFDINIARVAMLANGRYLWLIGDDDKMVPGSVKRLVESITANADKDIGVIFLNQVMQNRKRTRYGFADFRAFRKEDLRFSLDIGAVNSVCLNTALAKKAIAMTSEQNGRLFKQEYGGPILHGFAHSYLFLECMKRGAYVGVEPSYGMLFTASGEKTTYIKKMYLELLVAVYFMEIKRYYPWFIQSGTYNFSDYWKKLFSTGAVACERPELEPAYRTLFRMYLEILAGQHRGIEALASQGFELFRRTPLGRAIIIPLHHYMRKRQGLDLDPKPNTVKDIDKNLAFIVGYAGKMLARA